MYFYFLIGIRNIAKQVTIYLPTKIFLLLAISSKKPETKVGHILGCV